MEQAQPQVHIPAQPEFFLHGLNQQLSTRILECSRGGYIVIFEGVGVAGRSSWGEVINCIEDVGYDHLKITRPEPVIPSGIDPTMHEPILPQTSDGVTVHSAWLAVLASIATVLVFWSTRIS